MGAVAYVGELVEREGIECDFRRTGMLGLAVKSSHAQGFERHNDYLKERFGYTETQFLPKEALGSEIGSQIYHGGAIFEMCYQVQPAKFSYGLALAAQRAGAKVVEKALVNPYRAPGRPVRDRNWARQYPGGKCIAGDQRLYHLAETQGKKRRSASGQLYDRHRAAGGRDSSAPSARTAGCSGTASTI